MKIAGVQMDVKIGENEANLLTMERHLRRTVAQGAQLTVFPECALSGYCFNSLEEARPVAEQIPGPATERLHAICSYGPFQRRLGSNLPDWRGAIEELDQP
ncbi:MAG: carbon-nitrogen hydrolase family protein, partial [Deltaproteobacteria bacterium]|nr:carbon-nitrogen hydrolase family protein [Deltaproteobacteria bacterium]